MHPHVRGDYGGVAPGSGGRGGASPRAWGLRPRSSTLTTSWSVHPHVRGDYPKHQDPEEALSGASPRAWGLLADQFTGNVDRRCIPTCVGTTTVYILALALLAVHPHVRGDYRVAASWEVEVDGASPRAWGLPGEGRRRGPPPSVHPHVRGDYGCRFCPPEGHCRCIPTCVGTTRPEWPARTGTSVHPHVRGDYMKYSSAALSQGGASPRAWGLRTLALAEPGPRRCIPTCVGTTSSVQVPSTFRYGASPRAWGLRPRA